MWNFPHHVVVSWVSWARENNLFLSWNPQKQCSRCRRRINIFFGFAWIVCKTEQSHCWQPCAEDNGERTEEEEDCANQKKTSPRKQNDRFGAWWCWPGAGCWARFQTVVSSSCAVFSFVQVFPFSNFDGFIHTRDRGRLNYVLLCQRYASFLESVGLK